MIKPAHTVSITVDGKEIRGWTEYRIDCSMLEPADSFSLTIPASEDVWDILRTDRPVRVTIDGVPRCAGFIDDTELSAKSGEIRVNGRDKAGRLVQESADAINYSGLTLTKLIAKLTAPWFSMVTLSNARNRKVMRGRGKKVASSDAVYVDSQVGRRIEPGQMRWAVIEELCRQAGYLCWSSADGRELIVGKPDYQQEVQHAFFQAAPGSAGRSNVLDMTIRVSTGDRYSKITVLGAGAGTPSNYGRAVATRTGVVKNNPIATHGDGRDFSAPKRLVIPDREVKDTRAAQELARRQMAERDMRAKVITVTADHHGQVVQGQYRTLFAPDTLAHYHDEITGESGVGLIISCTYAANRMSGETTTLELLPRGTELAA